MGIAWSIWAILVVVSGVVGWVGSDVIQRQFRQASADPTVPPVTVHAWGQPDLAPPSTSPEARAEIVELETLWRQSRRRRR